MSRMENMEAAQNTSFLLQSIFSHVTDAILIVDKQGYVMELNPAAEKMTGWSKNELIGIVPFCEICVGMATVTNEFSCVNCFASGNCPFPSFEMKIRRRDGKEIHVAASSTRLPEDQSGALVIILRDMSEQYYLEQQRFRMLMTNYVIHAQEEERKRVSRELHDGIGQALYSILVGLKVVNQLQLDRNVGDHLLDVQQMTARALEEVKSMAVELRPSALDDLGLLPAIRSYMKRYEQTFGIETILEVTGEKRRYSPSIETALYRICQEAMTNAAKYADTDKILVEFNSTKTKLKLTILDYGCGFDPSSINIRGTGLGLYGMRERASLLRGEVNISSSPGDGTKIEVIIPINEKGEPIHVDSGTCC
ncbi:MAG TPA: PAS domain-containing sensor histidine kinase [Bacillota bacterium]|nr:PAS domain-containing sensor histidine kinase [Bacillota bacterium]